MPIFEMHTGVSADVPYAWCRVKIDRVAEGSQAGSDIYRFTWAFGLGVL